MGARARPRRRSSVSRMPTVRPARRATSPAVHSSSTTRSRSCTRRGNTPMRARMKTVGLALLAFVAIGGVARALTIADLVTGRDTYDGKVVTVTGTVERPVPVGSESLYDLRDGAAKISVISRASAPAAGASLTVTGTVYSVEQGDGGPEDIIFPVVIKEASRQAP